ncbi:DNA-processing protein DprA [Demequina sp. NBRC 110051]|uniref:DNA-processing protein DprA n=1 Tax=Demequina sp. NBRC 110051 TaxID=1570340 RepID=UPI000A052C94|nr:DNA-processing protein DprA [Demequina sp. NBRC 110051]
MSEERDALLRWAVIAEAGDSAAAWLVHALGPAPALAWASAAVDDPVTATARLAPLAPVKDVDTVIAAVPRWTQRLDGADPRETERRARVCRARLLVRGDPGWPAAFGDLAAAEPYALWVRGDADLDAAWGGGVALVGSRSATAYGEHVTAEISGALAEGDLAAGRRPRAVISGGAYGIDARAHRAALAVGGTTVAVLAGGIDQWYPAGNAELLDRIVSAGAVVSETPPGQAPYRSRFLSRNRLIAAASATVVVEAAVRSGALNTVAHALRMVRPIGAVPGPVTSTTSAGCHELIRDDKAVLVRHAKDVEELAGPLDPRGEPDPVSGPDYAHPHDRAAFDAVGGRGASATDVAMRAGLTATEAMTSLGRLELAGAVTQSGGVWRRRREA